MNMIKSRKNFLKLIVLAAIFFAFNAEAATLNLIPDNRSLKIGQEFSVDLKVNTNGVSINAAQATVNFPNNILTLLSVDKANSIFNFWVEEPTISNQNGNLKLIGGTPSGLSGGALQILRLKFKATGSGSANLTISDAVVTASDGKGTNVLSTVEGTSVGVGTAVVAPTPPPLPVIPAAPPAEQPQIIERREPVVARNLPVKPILKVPLYPDESRWYNRIGELVALWEVPEDVSAVATVLDHNLKTDPAITEKDLLTGKNFGPLAGDGIWYVHVRFLNNRGWGPTAHYKISLDSTPPLSFEIQMDNPISDNPTPIVNFETFDSLSGIDEAVFFIDNQESARTKEKTLALSRQQPGRHRLLVKIFDTAGNSVEDDFEFEILPLESPVIEFLTKTVTQGEVVFVAGKSMPNSLIDIRVLNELRQEVFFGEANSDILGNWEVIIAGTLFADDYSLNLNARDSRGAVSLTVEEVFRVKPKAILSFGFVDLGLLEVFILVISLAAGGAGVVVWQYISAKRTRGAYNIIASRDVEKLAALLETDLSELERLYKKEKGITPEAVPQMDLRFHKLKETIVKIKKYLVKELEKLQ